MEQTLRFGAKSEHIAISIEQGMSHSRGLDPDDESTWNPWPADAAYVRLWQRMLPTRPSQGNAPVDHKQAEPRDSPLISEFGNKLGLDALDKVEFDEHLRGVWQDYIELEQRIVSAAWLPDGWLDVRASSARDRRGALIAAADQWLMKALDTVPGEHGALAIDLRAGAEQRMRFGDRDEHFALLVDSSGSHTRANEGEAKETSSFASQPDPAYARIWQRMLPTRPSQPK